MYTIILLAALGLLGGTVQSLCDPNNGDLRNKDNLGFAVTQALFSAFAGLVLFGLFGTMFALLVGCNVPKKYVVQPPIELAAMSSEDGSVGVISRSSSIDSGNTYNFLQLQKNGIKVPGSVPADDRVEVIQDPNLKNTGIWLTTVLKPDPSSPLYPWSIGQQLLTESVRQEFRVPVGTVVQQFNIK